MLVILMHFMVEYSHNFSVVRSFLLTSKAGDNNPNCFAIYDIPPGKNLLGLCDRQAFDFVIPSTFAARLSNKNTNLIHNVTALWEN